ncbi:MAG: glycerophosphodiester phosphodiesterase family protein [Ignavibacteriaceae bacterium]
MLSKFNRIKIWFKEFYKRCPRKIQFTQNDPPFLIIGHRGAPYKEPENTIPSFELALQEGANALEVDIALTGDNHVILWHDWDPNDTTAVLREAGFEPWVKYKPHPPNVFNIYRKPVNQLTLKEVRDNFDYKKRKGKLHLPANAHIPTLEEFFQWASDKEQILFVFFDNKAPEAEKGCAVQILDYLEKLCQKYSPHFRIIIETSFPECLYEMKAAHPELMYSMDIEPPPGFILEPEDYSPVNAAITNNNNIALGLRPRKITFANWTIFRRIMQTDIKKIREIRRSDNNEMRLIAATVSKNKELRCLVRLGVDGIQTDFPGRLKKITARYKRKIASPELIEKMAG